MQFRCKFKEYWTLTLYPPRLPIPDCRDCNFQNSNLSTAYFMKAGFQRPAGRLLSGRRGGGTGLILYRVDFDLHAQLTLRHARGLPAAQPAPRRPATCPPLQSVLARANFENADLSDTLMDRSVIVEANLRGAVLQVGPPCALHAQRQAWLAACRVQC